MDLVPLASADRIRWTALSRPVDRHRFATGRALLAEVAARLLTCAEGAIWEVRCPRCASDRHGPVTVSTASGRSLQLSLSHSEGRVVVAASTARIRLGVDVEPYRGNASERRQLLDLVLAPEERAAFDTARPGHPDARLRGWWVRKEAVLKAARVGLSIDPRRVVVSPPSSEPRLRSDPAALGLSTPALYDLVDDGLASHACLCVDPGPARPVVRRVAVSGLAL